MTLYPDCSSVTFDKGTGGSYVINVDRGSGGQAISLLSLIKPMPHNSQTSGPCAVEWQLCGDQSCKFSASVDGTSMKIDSASRTLVINPHTNYAATTVYLRSEQNGVQDYITISYTVNEPYVAPPTCKFKYPYGAKINLDLD